MESKNLKKSLPGLFSFIRYFWPELRKERLLIVGSFIALFAEIFMRLLQPWPIKFVIDRVIDVKPDKGNITFPEVYALDPMTILAAAAIGVVAIALLRGVAQYLNKVGFALIGNRLLTEVRGKVYLHLQKLSLSFHNRARGGDLVVRVIGDVGKLQEVAVTAVMPLLGDFLILIGMIGIMFWLHWQLALLSTTVLPLFWFTNTRLSRKIHDAYRKQRKREGAMAATAAESMGAIKVVQSLSLDGTFSSLFTGLNKKSLKAEITAQKLTARLERTVDVLIALSTALVLWFGARLVLGGELSPGDLIVFLSYLKSAYKPLQDYAKYSGRLSKARAAGERVLNLLDEKPDVYDLPGAVPAPPFKGEVLFDDVWFAYEPGHPVLKGINLKLSPGQRVAIIGGSGNGKSTLVNLILRLYDPTEGSIIIDGHDIRSYILASLRSQISVVLQDTILFASTVRENIAYGRPDASPEEIEVAAKLANAHNFISALPQGYDTILGERGVTLSNGQRQRIAIARAAIRNAPILILDEPTVGLDEENKRIVSEALEKLSEGRTTVLVTHNLKHAARADRIIFLENGSVLECGSHEELLSAKGRYAAMLRLQTSGIKSVIQGGK